MSFHFVSSVVSGHELPMKKAAYWQELEEQFVCLQNLIQPNEQLCSSGNATGIPLNSTGNIGETLLQQKEARPKLYGIWKS